MRLQTSCPICQKPLVLISSIPINEVQTLSQYKCGHSFVNDEEIAKEEKVLDFTSVDGTKKARPYQEKGVEFIINSNFSCLIGDQMRLGKTPQALLALKNSDRFPALGLVRAANIYQWAQEYKTWVSPKINGIWIIQGTQSFIPPGFDFYLISMDTFGRRGTCKNCKHQFHDEECKKCAKEKKSCRVCVPADDAMSDILLKFGFKIAIVDEAHSFKNTDSNRSQALTTFLKEIEQSETVHEVPFTCMMCKTEWVETVTIKVHSREAEKQVTKSSHCPNCFALQSQSSVTHVKVKRNCGVVMLSGTFVKNRVGEMFVPLNLANPEKFHSEHSFRRNYLMQDDRGKWTRIDPHKLAAFKRDVAPYLLRREKEDVYDETPKLDRIFTVIQVQDEKLKKAYNKVLDQLEENCGRADFTFFSSIGELQQLRQICGLAKVDFISNYAETFVYDNEKAKLAIGIHHHSVRDLLSLKLDKYGVMKLSGEDSPETKFRIMRDFETSSEQLLVINMLAGGVGMDFHYCNYALVAERQWSSADEEQFEFRFYNPDKSIKTAATTIEYILAEGTIDKFFYEMVEEKRAIFGESLGTNWSLQTDTKSFKELIKRTIGSRL